MKNIKSSKRQTFPYTLNVNVTILSGTIALIYPSIESNIRKNLC
ncbi:hypothetical protein OQH60_00670 [Campylobacter sp. MIT 21-1685]|nr:MULTISPECIES: hypothetical protein [unclassified Campylobacter]MCX2682301.1 hypothetical protein [Campylobacter sp. MIT 21-1684]MCX2750581.1 hypothetical protein [Campylobacter sp. MIT 21-1682]MCX2806872.1 hypothetical protein [Campylobacter sp. MIT 21-1685]